MLLPCSSTPVGAGRQAVAASRCCPRVREHEGSGVHNRFRGSMTRLRHLLSMLPNHGYPRQDKTRFRRQATPYRVGLAPTGIHLKGFRTATSSVLLSQALPGADTNAVVGAPPNEADATEW